MNGKISDFSQCASLRRYTLSEGRGKGLDVIDCDNGKLRFLINVSKACDIMQLYHAGENISFVSKNGFTKSECDFLRRFEGGMLYTCGLDSVGGRKGYELHGNFHNLPAEIIRAECNRREIVVESVVRDTSLFGKNLALYRRISTEPDSLFVKVEDTLVNEGYSDEQYCLLYHVNLGYPMLDSGAKIVAKVNSVSPRNEWSEKNQEDMYEIGEPKIRRDECCYFLNLDSPEISLINETIGKRFTLTYSKDTLPHFVEWKSEACGDYALGLEPATTALDENFEYKTIRAGERVSFSLNMEVSVL